MTVWLFLRTTFLHGPDQQDVAEPNHETRWVLFRDIFFALPLAHHHGEQGDDTLDPESEDTKELAFRATGVQAPILEPALLPPTDEDLKDLDEEQKKTRLEEYESEVRKHRNKQKRTRIDETGKGRVDHESAAIQATFAPRMVLWSQYPTSTLPAFGFPEVHFSYMWCGEYADSPLPMPPFPAALITLRLPRSPKASSPPQPVDDRRSVKLAYATLYKQYYNEGTRGNLELKLFETLAIGIEASKYQGHYTEYLFTPDVKTSEEVNMMPQPAKEDFDIKELYKSVGRFPEFCNRDECVKKNADYDYRDGSPSCCLPLMALDPAHMSVMREFASVHNVILPGVDMSPGIYNPAEHGEPTIITDAQIGKLVSTGNSKIHKTLHWAFPEQAFDREADWKGDGPFTIKTVAWKPADGLDFHEDLSKLPMKQMD
ncbi:hypothetical protein PG993_008979 [Apiospora rasikravindrae]|uniref:Uncharacterized protein n=1 Tax=Apiospora rasikravindrae TaxID=990691 RepID=A0ABR1SI76_9PEZI